MVLSSLDAVALPDRPRLLGEVDADRAPGDATAAADAARGAELVQPSGELVRHPLPVARLGRRPHAAAVKVGKRGGEARVPAPHALGRFARQVGQVLDACAKAGRA